MKIDDLHTLLFQTIDIKSRLKEYKSNFLDKIKQGIEKIREAFEKETSNSQEERLFLEIFHEFIIDEKGCCLLNKRGEKVCIFNLKNHNIFISYSDIVKRFENIFCEDVNEIEEHIKTFLKKYFNVHDEINIKWIL